MKIKSIAVLLAILTTMTFAADQKTESKWGRVATSTDGTLTVDALAQSGQLLNTNGGTPVYVGVFRQIKDSRTIYFREYIVPADCDVGHGLAHILDMAGNAAGSVGYVLTGNTIGDDVAATLCSAYRIDLKDQQNQKNQSITLPGSAADIGV